MTDTQRHVPSRWFSPSVITKVMLFQLCLQGPGGDREMFLTLLFEWTLLPEKLKNHNVASHHSDGKKSECHFGSVSASAFGVSHHPPFCVYVTSLDASSASKVTFPNEFNRLERMGGLRPMGGAFGFLFARMIDSIGVGW